MTNQQEQLIINKVLGGDNNAFGALVEQYQDMAYTIAIRLLNDPDEAADVVQESFVKSYEVLERFRGDSKFSTWIYKIVYRKSLDRIKHLKRRRTDSYEEVQEKPYMVEGVDNAMQALIKEERKTLVKEAIALLTPDEQTLITLYYFEEASVKEISEIMELGMENVKVKLFRTRKKLFTLLKGQVDNITV